MHFEILVEGQCELTMLSILMGKIIGEYKNPHTWKIHKHQGIGKIPDNPAQFPSIKDKSLLHNLPSKLRAYGKEELELAVVVLVDLDDRNDCAGFKAELVSLLNCCVQKPTTIFCIAIEEIEAWYLGDLTAIKTAYPEAKQDISDNYIQDAQIGTWEVFAEMVYPDGLSALQTKYGKRSRLVLEEKVNWAKNISPHMTIENNKSPSFNYFVKKLQAMITP